MRNLALLALVLVGCAPSDQSTQTSELVNMAPSVRLVHADGVNTMFGSGHPFTFPDKDSVYMHTLTPSPSWEIGEGDYTFHVFSYDDLGATHELSLDPPECRRIHLNSLGQTDLVYNDASCAHASMPNLVSPAGGLVVQLRPFADSRQSEIQGVNGMSLQRFFVFVVPVDPAQTSGYVPPEEEDHISMQTFHVETGPAVCGDGVLTLSVGGGPGEQCDDGNNVDGDGCTADCRRLVCGDGIVENGEQCEDGNTVGGDGCSAQCMFDSVCGDGMIGPAEDCEDGNNVGGDGCSATCNFEVICGNGVREENEECDDDNTANGDGCSSTCMFETVCGNGVREGVEQCDDGNQTIGDGCAPNCLLEGPTCGNGMTEGNEGCDDGNSINGDGCSVSCQPDGPVCCGDGTLDAGEQCDDGNKHAGDGCSPTCTLE